MNTTEFAQTLELAKDVEGWMTDDQARRLWECAASLSGGRIVEIGSFRGRSLIVLARASSSTTELVAIDPHIGSDRGPQEIEANPDLGASDYDQFHSNLTAAGVNERVRHVRKLSEEALPDVTGTIELLYIDGAHRYGPARDDIESWGERVSPGGTLLIHDSFSSIGVTLAILRLLAFGSRFRYVGRSGSLAEYREAHLSTRERLSNGWRQLRELPWFVKNVLIKVAIVARIRPLARVLGHEGTDWPY